MVRRWLFCARGQSRARFCPLLRLLNTETPAVLTAPTVVEITAMATRETTRCDHPGFSQLSSVREIMEALGQLE